VVRDVALSLSGRHRHALYLRDAGDALDVRAARIFFWGRIWPRGIPERAAVRSRQDFCGEPLGSLAQLDAGSVSLECRESLQSVAYRAAKPESARLGDDQHVPAVDADLDRTEPIAERLPDLPLDPPPGGGVGVFV
jgi:hypothetical protein